MQTSSVTLDYDARFWVDDSQPGSPREVTEEHVAADADHPVEPFSDFGDDVPTNCTCGLAATSDGLRHGFDA